MLRTEFAGQQMINGRPTWELRLYMDNQYHKSLNYDSSAEGIRLHRDRLAQWPDQDLYEVYDPPLLFLPGQMQEGAVYTDSTSNGGQWFNGSEWVDWIGSCNRQMEVVGLETITVPAGTFEALRVNFVQDSDAMSWEESWDRLEHLEGTWWFAEGLGPVKFEQDWFDTDYLGNEVVLSSTGHTSMEMLGDSDPIAVPEPAAFLLGLFGAALMMGFALSRRGAGLFGGFRGWPGRPCCRGPLAAPPTRAPGPLARRGSRSCRLG